MSSEPQSGPKADDSFIAIIILAVALVIVITGAVYAYANRYKLGLVTIRPEVTSNFTPPKEREMYLAAKAEEDATSTASKTKLKKLLMRRAMATIPLLLTLRNEGTSIERLYKKGLLTDEMNDGMKNLKAFIDQEFEEIQAEADELSEGWSGSIWPQAMQHHQILQQLVDGRDGEKEVVEDSVNSSTEAKSEKRKDKPKKSKDANMSLTPEQLRELEAERAAKQLIEEEERDKKKKTKSTSGKGQKK